MEDWKLKPAADLGLTREQRLKSLKRETGPMAALLRLLARRFLRVYLRGYHRWRVEGVENLPPPPFVMVANHSSHLDAPMLAAALPGAIWHCVYPLAAADTFFQRRPVAGLAVAMLNLLPLSRRRTTHEHIDTLRARLAEDGCVFILFPEGTRSRDGTMAPFKPGIGTLVAGSAVPVVPCWIEGAYAAMPAHAKFPRPLRLRLRIGAPLNFVDRDNHKPGWTEIAAAAEAAVRALSAPDPASRS